MNKWWWGLVVGMGLLLVAYQEKEQWQRIDFRRMMPGKMVKLIEKEPEFEEISLGRIFELDHEWTATIAGKRKIELIATGDVIPARTVNTRTVGANDFTWAFKQTGKELSQAEITMINLETPLLENCPLTDGGMIFCGDKRQIQGLIWAGVDVAGLGNNHAGNYGIQGIEETVSLLENNGIVTVGRGNLGIKEVKGVRFGFLSYNDVDHREPGISWADEETIEREIGEARGKVEVLVVGFHWGIEYTSQPTERQRQLGHLAIDKGADLVIGNHPHWIQPVEIYRGKVMVYAHGNFIFDQMWSQKTREGVVGKYIFYGDRLVDIEFWPVQIDDYGQAHWLKGRDKGREILEEMERESRRLEEDS